MRVGLGISNRYGVSINFCVTFANIVRHIKHELVLAHDNHFALDVSRNTVIRNLLAYNPDKIFIMDSDIIPFKCNKECSIFYDVINYFIDNYSKYDIVGVYHFSKKLTSNVYVFEKRLETEEELYEPKPVTLKINSGIHKVDALGLGLVMIDPSVFKKIDYPWFRIYLKYADNKEIVVGEDIYFFSNCKKHKIDVYVTTDVIALHESTAYLIPDGKVCFNPFSTYSINL